MSTIDPPAGWDEVDGINTNERLLGGPSGPLNRAVTGLTARTKQLRGDIEQLTGPDGAVNVFHQVGTGPVLSVAALLDLTVNVRSFGASGGADDATAAFQAAAAAVPAGGVIHVPAGVYVLSATVLLNWQTSLDCAVGAVFKPAATSVFTADAMFMVNTADGVTTSPRNFPNVCGVISGLSVDNSATPTQVVGALILGAPCLVQNIRTNSTYFTVKTTDTYLDHFRVNGAFITQPRGPGYQIVLTGLGDGLVLQSVHAYSDIGTPNSIQLVNCRGGAIIGSIGGNHRFSRCSALTMQGFHLETGQIISRGSDLALRDGFFYCGAGPRIVFEDTAERRTAVLDNLRMVFNIDSDKIPVGYTGFDVQVCDSLALSVRDCFKVTGADADSGKSEQCGILLTHVTTGAVLAWNRYSYAFSRFGQTTRPGVVASSVAQDCGSGALFTLTFSSLTSATVWRETSGTYYYNAALVWDPVRLVGITNSEPERVHSLTEGGQGVMLPLNGLGSLSAQGFLRLYRGALPGVYDRYVDVPIINCATLFDNGRFVNGFPWQTRTAGGKDLFAGTSFFSTDGRRCVLRRDGAPSTAGTFAAGDRVEFAPVVAGGKIGAVCTTGGTPGTWKSWGAVDT